MLIEIRGSWYLIRAKVIQWPGLSYMRRKLKILKYKSVHCCNIRKVLIISRTEYNIQERISSATGVEWVSMQRRETSMQHMIQSKRIKYLMSK